jgi:hypothetical protein
MCDELPILVAARFIVVGPAEAGFLPRLLAPFARRDLTPETVRAHRQGAAIRAEIHLTMPRDELHLVAGNLGQIVGVSRVESMEGRVLALRVNPTAAEPAERLIA